MPAPVTRTVVLNVEDNEASRYARSRVLRHAGFEVVEATTGPDALRLARSPDVQLVLLDVNLPVMNGLEVCQRLKADPATASVLVLHMTATAFQPESRVEGLEGGADGYLVEPVTPDELVATVHALLRLRRAEELARAASRQWETTFAALGDGVCLLDADGRIIRCNAAATGLLGDPSGELVGRRFHELVSDPPGPGAGSAATRMLESRQRETEQLRVGERWLEIAADPVVDPAGRLTGGVCIVSDITERKRGEARRATQFAITRVLATSATTAEAVPELLRTACEGLEWDAGELWLAEEDGRRLRLAGSWEAPTVQPAGLAAAARDLALEPGQALPGRVWASGQAEWTGDVTADPAFRRGDAARRAGLHTALGVPVRDGGAQGALLFFTRALRPPDEQLLQVAPAVGSQVGEFLARKRAEERIARLNTDLRQRLAELQALLDVIPIGIAIAHDPACRRITANPALAQMLRLPHGADPSLWAQPGGRPPRVLRDGREVPEDELPLQVAAATGRQVSGFELVVVRADGTRASLLGSAAPLFDDDGRPRGAVGAFVDITERKEVEAERDELLSRAVTAQAEAEAANRAKDEFLTMLSHELRTPLSAIVGWLHLLRTAGLDEATRERALETIHRNARAQAQLIDDLLDMSRIVTGRLRLDLSIIDVEPVVRGAVDLFGPVAKAKGVQLDAVIEPRVGVVRGDPDRLQQIVSNLLSNALKFTPAGGHVAVVVARVASRVEVAVTDTGIGIAPEFLPHVFDRFRQADASTTRAHAGLGLGLTIARQLAELHGGSLRAESPGRDRGATFALTLPIPGSLVPRAADPRVDAGSPRPAPPGAPRLAGVTALVVDDEADARNLVAAILRAAGAEVAAVGSAAEALARLPEAPPDVLVADIGMPGVDGHTLVRRIRALPPERGGAVPAVALTAYARQEDRELSLAAGFQSHLAKPVDPDVLVSEIAGLVRSPRRPEPAGATPPD